LPAVGSYYPTAGTGGAAAPAAVATTGRTLGALGRLAANPWTRGAVLGAVEGGVAGAGAAGPDHRLGGGLTGTFIGGAAGTTIPVATRGLGAVGSWASGKFLPTEEKIAQRASDKINRAISEAEGGEGMLLSDIERKMKQDRARGIPSTLANADRSLMDLGETVAQRSGASARIVEKKLGEQAAGSRRRVYDRARKALGGKDYFEDERKLVQDLRAGAKDVYADAYSIGEVNNPRILEILKSPRFKQFYDEARKIADTEALAAKLRGEDPAKYALRDLYSVAPDGSIVVQKLPDVRTLDYIKRGIDAVVDKGFRGEGLSTAEANALKDVRKHFVGAIDEATTDPSTGISPYRFARQSYAGDMEVIDALRAGREQFKKISHQEVARLMSEMGTAEKEAFRTGALQHIYEEVMSSRQNINAANRLVGSPETVAKLAPLFESQKKFNLFVTALQREAELVQQSQRILGGAATGRRVQARERFEEDEGVGEAVGDMMKSGFWGSIGNLVNRALRGDKMKDSVADKVAKLLMSSDPTEVAAAVKTLEHYGNLERAGAKALRGREAAIIGGTVATAPPAPMVEGKNLDIDAAETGMMYQDGPDIEKDLMLLDQEGASSPGSAPTSQDDLPDIDRDIEAQSLQK